MSQQLITSLSTTTGMRRERDRDHVSRRLVDFRRPTAFMVGPGSMACLHDARGVLLRVTCGHVWVTQEGELIDAFVATGGSLRITRNGLTIVSWHRVPQSWVTLEPAGAPA